MTEIRLTNTATRRKEVFRPLDPENVRMYVCGPTVYDRAHLGNARPVVVFDVLYRLLRHVYGPEHVTYVRNYTDVDDKINARAAELKAAGDTRELTEIVRALTDETIAWYEADMGALGTLKPDHTPRATEYIGPMVAMIEDLIEKGVAYEAEGHVLFAVDRYDAYGALSGRSIEDMIAGARVEVAPYKRNPMDFVLWKPSGPDLPGWDSPWGRGRPGWHIECSAMAEDLLWKQPAEKGLLSAAAMRHPHAFDIHGGGIDLQFPHHENEIAQSKACCGQDSFARVWMHNEMLQVEGKKMSKSLGNFFTVHDLLEQGIPGEVIRFVFLMTHYSKPMDWTAEKARQAEATLRKWREITDVEEPGRVHPQIINDLSDDLNTPKALSELYPLAHAGDVRTLKASAQLLGLLTDELGGWTAASTDTEALIQKYIQERVHARTNKDWVRADAIRDAFAAAGVELSDASGKTTWTLKPGFDPSKLEALK